jgi:hypothetical protein
MRAIHESDCDFQIVGICTCGAFNKCRRLGGHEPGLAEHEATIKKLRDLKRLEHDAAALNRMSNETTSAGGDSGSNV